MTQGHDLKCFSGFRKAGKCPAARPRAKGPAIGARGAPEGGPPRPARARQKLPPAHAPERSRASLVKTRYERLSSMAFWSIWSAVVTTLLLDWKPRWVMIMLTISVAMSTLESSILYAWTVP